MRVKFRGGPLHNKTREVNVLEHYLMVSIQLPIKYEYAENFSHEMNTRQHRYQIGKDEKNRKVYFHVGCV